jgi:hypothetical protein
MVPALTMWAWDPSVSIDVAAYVLLLGAIHATWISTPDGPQPIYTRDPWAQIGRVTGLSCPDTIPVPPAGDVAIFDVESEDTAGNVSPSP